MPLLEVHDLAKHFQSHAGVIHAVNGVSFSLDAGRSLALVGESGSGKSTVARCVVRLVEPTAGKIVFDGVDVTRLARRSFRRVAHRPTARSIPVRLSPSVSVCRTPAP